MPRYRYQAVDAQGNPVTGRVEAAGIDEALARLAAEGLKVEREAVAEVLPQEKGGSRLTVAEAAEVGGGVAEMARAGLPLAPGLRAMADELSNRRVSRCLVRIAGRLEAGASLEEAIGAEGPRFPGHVRGLILAGGRSGKLAEALDLFVGLVRQRRDLRWRVWASVAYPLLLVVFTAALFTFICTVVVTPFAEMYEDFGAELPVMTQLAIAMSRIRPALAAGVIGAIVFIGLLLWLAPQVGWLQNVLYHFPLLGPLWRWQGLVEFSKMMAILLDEQVPLPEALRITADGLKGRRLAWACRQSADLVEAGHPLSDCAGRFWEFPHILRPFVEWGQRTSRPAEAFRVAAEVFERGVSTETELWEIIAPPVFLVFIAGCVGFLVLSLFMPLLSITYSLT